MTMQDELEPVHLNQHDDASKFEVESNAYDSTYDHKMDLGKSLYAGSEMHHGTGPKINKPRQSVRNKALDKSTGASKSVSK